MMFSLDIPIAIIAILTLAVTAFGVLKSLSDNKSRLYVFNLSHSFNVGHKEQLTCFSFSIKNISNRTIVLKDISLLGLKGEELISTPVATSSLPKEFPKPLHLHPPEPLTPSETISFVYYLDNGVLPRVKITTDKFLKGFSKMKIY